MESQDNLFQVKNHTGTTEMVEALKNSMLMAISQLTVLVKRISIKKLNSHGLLLVTVLTLLQFLTL
jgi:hypothetical protein